MPHRASKCNAIDALFSGCREVTRADIQSRTTNEGKYAAFRAAVLIAPAVIGGLADFQRLEYMRQTLAHIQKMICLLKFAHNLVGTVTFMLRHFRVSSA